jgi:hypothetical protein
MARGAAATAAGRRRRRRPPPLRTLPREGSGRRLLTLVSLAVVCFAKAGSALGSEPTPATTGNDGYIAPVCGDPDVATLAAVDCAGIEGVPSLDPADMANPPTVESLSAAAAAETASQPSPAQLPEYCRQHVDVAFYTSSDWVRLGQKLLADASPCADYFITIPPLAADKTALRCLQDDLIRALGPRFHPVAEFHFTGWDAWVRAVPGRTFADAATEFLKRVKACGYDFSLGETWSLNEVHSGVRRDNGNSRPNMRLLLDTLASGAGQMPPSRGFAWVIGVGQNTQNVSDYKRSSRTGSRTEPSGATSRTTSRSGARRCIRTCATGVSRTPHAMIGR